MSFKPDFVIPRTPPVVGGVLVVLSSLLHRLHAKWVGGDVVIKIIYWSLYVIRERAFAKLLEV